MNRATNIVKFFLIFALCTLRVNATPPVGELTLSPKQINLGEVSSDTIVTFTLYNNTKEAVVITKAVTDCSCTKIKFFKKPILPTDSTQIEIKYLPTRDESGVFYKTIQVHTSNSKEPIKGIIRGKNIK